MHVLLVGAWPELVASLIGLPCRVTLLQLPAQVSQIDENWTHRLVRVDYQDVAAAEEAARGVHAVDPVDVVVGPREFSLPAVARIAADLALPSVPGPVSSLNRTKAEVRGQLNSSGCVGVPFRVCESATQVADFVRELGRPAILKPLNGAGSVGVHAVPSAADARRAWSYGQRTAGPGPMLAEQLVEGPEFSVETRSSGGVHEAVAVTEKMTGGAPRFVELGHVVPARVTEHQRVRLAREALWALDALGHRDGPSHVEVVLGSSGPHIIEVNRRLGGDRIWELVLAATGRDLMRESMLDALRAGGFEIGPQAAAIRFLVAQRSGSVKRKPALEYAGGRPESLVRRHATIPSPGTTLQPPRSSHDRLGYVLTVARDPDHAVDQGRVLAEQLVQNLQEAEPATHLPVTDEQTADLSRSVPLFRTRTDQIRRETT